MPEYIEREALTIENLEKYMTVMEVNTKEYGQQVVVAVDDLMYLPAADVVEVRHGHIIETVKNGKCNRVFSCCGKDYTKLTQWIIPNYCPNCGADMRGENK